MRQEDRISVGKVPLIATFVLELRSNREVYVCCSCVCLCIRSKL